VKSLSRIVLLVALCVWAAPARAAFFGSESVDGPSAAIQQLSGIAIAHDGTGGLVEVKQDGGANHIFVSRLVNGVFGAPERVDGGLTADSTQPTITANDGGELMVAFVNGGTLYVVTRPSGSTSWRPAGALYNGASDPDIAVSIHDKGYIAFTAPGPGGHDVRVARYRNGNWAVLPSPLDANAADDAGVGTGRPRVAAAGDGQAVVVWGENGGVFDRRVWDVNPSVVFAQASVPAFQGHAGGAADLPEVGVGDDSSFALVTFRQRFAQGAQTFARGMARRLRGSAFDDPVAVDGLAFPVAEDAGAPAQGVDNHTAGLIATTLTASHETFGATANGDAFINNPARMDAAPSATFSQPAAALGRDDSGLIAYQHDAGPAGNTVVVRQWDGQSFGPEASIATPAFGPPDAATGVLAASDRVGDVAVAFVQGSAGATRIVVGGFDKPPGNLIGRTTQLWSRRTKPTLKWTLPTDLWGGVTFAVTLDGQPLATTRFSHIVPAKIPDGDHQWQVVAVDRHGQRTPAPPRRLRIDSTKPTAKLSISGSKKAGKTLRFRVRAADPPPPVPPGTPAPATSGVHTVRIDFGDHTTRAKGTRATHRYHRGRYTVRVTVIDKAGNAFVLKQKLRIRK
jgi:PKD domain